jgi:hypothetical protein
MKVKELIEMLEGKEDYDIDIDYVNEIFQIEINDELQSVSLVIEENESEDEDEDCCDFDGNCEECEDAVDCKINPDNAWRYSNYECKDIGDWSVDDHLAAWYDHQMEK